MCVRRRVGINHRVMFIIRDRTHPYIRFDTVNIIGHTQLLSAVYSHRIIICVDITIRVSRHIIAINTRFIIVVDCIRIILYIHMCNMFITRLTRRIRTRDIIRHYINNISRIIRSL